MVKYGIIEYQNFVPNRREDASQDTTFPRIEPTKSSDQFAVPWHLNRGLDAPGSARHTSDGHLPERNEVINRDLEQLL